MPLGTILSKQAVHTLTQLHAELAGKIKANATMGEKLRAQMIQVEAVIKLLEPGFNVRIIAPKRRNTGNPWFKRGTLYRSAVDVLRRSQVPMTARELSDALLKGKTPPPTREQAINIQAAILAALRSHQGLGIERVGEAEPAKWRLAQQSDM